MILYRGTDMIDKKQSCAFTGHRPSLYRFGFDEEHPDCLKIKLLMAQKIGELISGGVKNFLSGMALGADIWAAEIVLGFRESDPEIKLTAVIPCETQADKWSAEQRERYFNILAECDETVYIRRHYTPSCMFERNRYLIDNSDVLLAVYNGCKKGGTAFTVRYAKSLGKEVIIIDPENI